MKAILNQLFNHQKLTRDQAKDVLINMSKGEYNPSQIAAFISVYLMRTISVEELDGFREALLELCIPVDLEGVESIDVCGTGGDGKNTFNISTATAFVLAGAGYKVSKHGNYGVSSVCGSSNVLESLGYAFTTDIDQLKRQLDNTNICFFHAPLFHPALASVGPIRRDLRVKTFFNLLGPLVNPCQPTHQLVGVFSLKILKLYQYLLQQSNRQYTVVHAIDGYDEVSLTGDTKLIQNGAEKLVDPAYFTSSELSQESIFGGDDVESAAKIFVNVLMGNGTEAQNAVVKANAGLAIQTFKPEQVIGDCVAEAEEALLAGKGIKTLEQLIAMN